ncbi:hypothetical protein XETH111194_15000 [Xenorhabdus thuongxuanensis]
MFCEYMDRKRSITRLNLKQINVSSYSIDLNITQFFNLITHAFALAKSAFL